MTVRYATVPLDVARRREAVRAAQSGRHVPDDVVTAGHRESTRGFRNVIGVAGIAVEVWDTSDESAIVIAQRGTEGIEVLDPGRYHRFLEKANE